MKILQSCPHIQLDDSQKKLLANELFHPDHDGRFFTITELCYECAVREIQKWYNEADQKAPGT